MEAKKDKCRNSRRSQLPQCWYSKVAYTVNTCKLNWLDIGLDFTLNVCNSNIQHNF